MKNRFQFHDEEIGRTIHCVIIEVPRKGARVACVSKGGKFYRVPVNLLKHVPENSSIDDTQAIELIERGIAHLQKSHEKDTKSLVWYMNHAGQYELKQKVTKSLFV